jgi:2-dehydropantoate 2-reductase
MRIGIIGIGGIGGYFATRLIDRYQNRDHQIVFIQRGAHLETIRRDGLRYLTKDHEYLARPVLATDRPQEAGLLDAAIICVKGYDLESAAGALHGNLDRHSLVLTTLNGVDITDRVRNVLPSATVLPGCIYMSAHVEHPGVVQQVGGVGNYFFGPTDGQCGPYQPVEDILKEAGIKAVLTGDIKSRLWEKYLFVCPFATITSARGVTIGKVMADPAMRAELVCLMKEIQTLAASDGVVLPDSALDDCLARAGKIPPETRTSMEVDFAAGRRTELNLFTGYVVEHGKKLGLNLSCHDELYAALLKKIN